MSKKYLTLTKEDYTEALENNICTIVFEKLNGELREMQATLIPDLLPTTEKELTEEKLDRPRRKQSTASLAVYDLVSGVWRSFRLGSVLVFKKLKRPE